MLTMMETVRKKETGPAGDSFEITLARDENYRFTVDFQEPGVASLVVDESPPLGEGAGPGPARLLAAAVGHCLVTSLLFCLERARVPVGAMSASVSASTARNEAGRLRVQRIDVMIEGQVAEADLPRFQRCVAVFEDYCTVSASVRESVDMSVTVRALTDSETSARLEG
jgi:uncharacterized OsmC-like protein